ncbi:MAG: hypothetical protein V8R11_04105 [Alphaproteobacteria bacterium]
MRCSLDTERGTGNEVRRNTGRKTGTGGENGRAWFARCRTGAGD